MSQPSPSTPTPTTSSAMRKPRVSLAIATAFGLGYLPKAPGTWGSLGGVALTGLYWLRTSADPTGTRKTLYFGMETRERAISHFKLY